MDFNDVFQKFDMGLGSDKDFLVTGDELLGEGLLF